MQQLSAQENIISQVTYSLKLTGPGQLRVVSEECVDIDGNIVPVLIPGPMVAGINILAEVIPGPMVVGINTAVSCGGIPVVNSAIDNPAI